MKNDTFPAFTQRGVSACTVELVHNEEEEFMMPEGSLVGFWKLVSYEKRTASGQILYPFGHEPIGYLMYTEDGHMSATVMRDTQGSHEHRFNDVNQVFSRLRHMLHRQGYFPKTLARPRFHSYCGRYETMGNIVTHHVEVSVHPEWPNTDQQHTFELHDNKLILTSSSEDIHQMLIWEQA